MRTGGLKIPRFFSTLNSEKLLLLWYFVSPRFGSARLSMAHIGFCFTLLFLAPNLASFGHVEYQYSTINTTKFFEKNVELCCLDWPIGSGLAQRTETDIFGS